MGPNYQKYEISDSLSLSLGVWGFYLLACLADRKWERPGQFLKNFLKLFSQTSAQAFIGVKPWTTVPHASIFGLHPYEMQCQWFTHFLSSVQWFVFDFAPALSCVSFTSGPLGSLAFHNIPTTFYSFYCPCLTFWKYFTLFSMFLFCLLFLDSTFFFFFWTVTIKKKFT